MTERDEDVVFLLPDGSSVAVPNDTVCRSAMLQEAIRTGEGATTVAITLPQCVLQDWIQSVDALKAATTSTGNSTGFARHPDLLKLGLRAGRIAFTWFGPCPLELVRSWVLWML